MPLGGLQLNDESLVYEQVQSCVTEQDSLVEDGDRDLPAKRDPPGPKLDAERLFVERLEEPWSKEPMHFDGRSNHRLGEPVQGLLGL
jgi:hypothetical protein